MKHLVCKGSCDQGRRACPHPEVCEEDAPDQSIFRVILGDLIIAVMLVAVVVLVVWGVMK